jgi:hypothetical protein
MHIDWQQVEAYLYDNRLPILGTLSLFVTAAIKTMPDPSVKWISTDAFKAWFYDFSHQYLNIKNDRVNPGPK